MIASESVKALRSVQQRGPKIVTMHPTYFIYNRVGKLKIFDIHVYIYRVFLVCQSESWRGEESDNRRVLLLCRFHKGVRRNFDLHQTIHFSSMKHRLLLYSALIECFAHSLFPSRSKLVRWFWTRLDLFIGRRWDADNINANRMTWYMSGWTQRIWSNINAYR